ncbi:MAG: hypothetical protein DWP92_09520 [Armatimonadetes bacterium]|nr:MAG: hypothetical protein DWP92_09520 [Armatimonadota bacterium]
MQRLLPWLWLGFSMAWAVVIFVTDQLAWPLAMWIATTVGPLTYLQTRSRPTSSGSDPQQNSKGENT